LTSAHREEGVDSGAQINATPTVLAFGRNDA
jgi:hypothetical protein